jgi:RHS repeat-associated protein
MAARLSRLLVALGLLFGTALPSAAAAAVRPPTSQEIAASPVPDRGPAPANARSYFGARYYRADVGRFTTVDPELNMAAALVDPQRWNRYAYVRNNPLRFTDPDGKDIWDLFAGMGNAIKSNFTFGVGRQAGGNSDFRVGQFAGDLISIPVGIAETVSGGGVELAGLAAEGPSLGTSTVVAAGGVMVMTQGGTAAIAGAAGAGNFLAKSANDLLGSGGGDKVARPGVSGREGAKDVPSWAGGNRPKIGESGKDFADRLCRDKYGPGNYPKGPGSEFNKIKKWGDRSFIDPQ